MKGIHLTIAAAAAGLLLAAGSASATPLAPKSTAAMGIDLFNTSVEPVHYRRYQSRRHYYPRYSYGGPAISFGLAPVVTPHYGYPYGYGYRSYPSYPYGYSYGYSPTFSFGLRLR